MLYRAQTRHRLQGPAGTLQNPNISRHRRPRDIPPELHIQLQHWFSAKFGVDYRGQALFCSGDLDVARGYARAHQDTAVIELMPTEPYSLCFSTVCKDLYGHFQFAWARNPDYLTGLDDDLERLQYVQRVNEGVHEAAATGNEVMVFSRSFAYRVIPD